MIYINIVYKNKIRLIATGSLMALLSTACVTPTIVVPTATTTDSTGDTTSTTTSTAAACPATISSSVTALYSAAPNWNDYVKVSDTTVVCDSAVTTGGYHTCIHGGERRKVVLTGITSCTGLTATDDLGLFDWICVAPGSGADAYFMSTRLKDTKGLADLIEPAVGVTFNSNFVTVKDSSNCTRVTTASAADWWTNTIANLTTGGASTNLSVASQIYTLTGDASNAGYVVTADKVSVVTLGTAILSWNGSGVSNCTGGYRAVVCATAARNFLWIEGKFDGGSATRASQLLQFTSLNYSRIYRVRATNSNNLGITLSSASTNNLLWQIKVFNAGLGGAGSMESINLMNTSSYNRLIDIEISNGASAGLQIFGGNNVVQRLSTANMAGAGIYFNAAVATNNIATLVTGLSGNENFGGHLRFVSADRNTALFVTSANQSNYGMRVDANSDMNTFANTLYINNTTGVYLEGDSNRFYRIGASGNTTSNLDNRAGSDSNEFLSALWVGNSSTNCAVLGTGNYLDGTCAYGANPPLTAATSTTFDITNALVAAVTSDATNPDGILGSVAYASIDTWTGFDSPYRGWGNYNVAAFPSSNHRGRCTAGTCQIWDLRFLSGASTLKEVNGTFSSSACPAAADSSTAANVGVDQNSTAANTFLLNAFEIMNDYSTSTGALIGDDDGLCETGESCIFSPNVGSYQGHGDYTTSGSILCAGGNGVTNVTLYGYPTNYGAAN